LEVWTVWKQLFDNGNFNNYKSVTAEEIKTDWWNDKWIPINYDGNGNHYCIDRNPTSDGNYGLIIKMWHDSSERELNCNFI